MEQIKVGDKIKFKDQLLKVASVPYDGRYVVEADFKKRILPKKSLEKFRREFNELSKERIITTKLASNIWLTFTLFWDEGTEIDFEDAYFNTKNIKANKLLNKMSEYNDAFYEFIANTKEYQSLQYKVEKFCNKVDDFRKRYYFDWEDITGE